MSLLPVYPPTRRQAVVWSIRVLRFQPEYIMARHRPTPVTTHDEGAARKSHRSGKIPIGWTILGVSLFSLLFWIVLFRLLF